MSTLQRRCCMDATGCTLPREVVFSLPLEKGCDPPLLLLLSSTTLPLLYTIADASLQMYPSPVLPGV